MQPAGDLVTQPGQVTVALGPHLQDRRVVLGGDLAAGPGPQRRDRHGQGIVRVVLVRSPLNSRTRDASFGWTSRTRSPAATSCWASSRPSPAAPSTAQVRSGHAAAHSASFPACAADARTRISPSGSSAAFDHHRRVRPLVRVHADHHPVIARSKCLSREWERGGHA